MSTWRGYERNCRTPARRAQDSSSQFCDQHEVKPNRKFDSVRAQVYRHFRTVRPHFSVQFSTSSPVIICYHRIERKFGLLNFSNVRYIYFLKMWLVWKHGEYNKSYARGSRKCHLKVLSIIFSFGIARWCVGWIAADFYPQLLKNSFLQLVCLLCIATQLVKLLACLLPCSGVTGKWHLSRSFYTGPAKWREIMEPKWRHVCAKRFPCE